MADQPKKKTILDLTDEEFAELEPGMPFNPEDDGDIPVEFREPDDPEVDYWTKDYSILKDGRICWHITSAEFYATAGAPPVAMIRRRQSHLDPGGPE